MLAVTHKLFLGVTRRHYLISTLLVVMSYLGEKLPETLGSHSAEWHGESWKEFI